MLLNDKTVSLMVHEDPSWWLDVLIVTGVERAVIIPPTTRSTILTTTEEKALDPLG
jgi:hypothetical protein